MGIDEFRRQFGLNVQRLRRHKGMSQEALAEAIGRSTDTVSNIERGIGFPRLDTAFSIAEALDVPLIALFDVGPARPLDRRKRKHLDELIELLSSADESILGVAVAQARILVDAMNGRQPKRRNHRD